MTHLIGIAQMYMYMYVYIHVHRPGAASLPYTCSLIITFLCELPEAKGGGTQLTGVGKSLPSLYTLYMYMYTVYAWMCVYVVYYGGWL